MLGCVDSAGYQAEQSLAREGRLVYNTRLYNPLNREGAPFDVAVANGGMRDTGGRAFGTRKPMFRRG